MTNFQQKLIQRIAAKKNKKNGFTLIELMIVVAILGVLVAVGLPELQKALNKGKAAAAESTLTNAAKECSLSLILNNDASDYDASGFTIDGTAVAGTCELDTTLTVTGEDGVDYQVELDGTVPGVVSIVPAA